MTTFPSSSDAWPAPVISDGYLPDQGLRHRRSKLRRWLSRRPVRVGLLLAAVWLLNGFDLTFTILASRLGAFIELNPVAAAVLGEGNYLGIVLYKASLVMGATLILWWYRRHRLSEVSCWMVALLYSALAFRWHRYYEVWNYYYHHNYAESFPA